MDFKIEVNNRMIEAGEGEMLLGVLQRNGFRIPTLCHMNRFSPTGACRLCVVEVEGKSDLITSCSCPVKEGMRVKTNSRRVIHARKSLVELLLSNHPDDCLYCQRNGDCELQWLAGELNVRERRYFGEKNKFFPDYSSSSVARDPAKCVLCSRCVRICEEVQLVTAIDFISRGNKTKVNSAFGQGLNVSSCIHCGQCIQVCPTAALLDISHLEKVQAALASDKKRVLFFISPSVIASVAERLDMRPKDNILNQLVSALKRCGADKVFDLGFANDINIMEDAGRLVQILKGGIKGEFPLISSCCPSWVRYAQEFRPRTLNLLSLSKSPQQVMGTVLKTTYAEQTGTDTEDIYTVAVMPCVAKKYEASLEKNTHKGISEVDSVLTVRELLRMLRSYGLNLSQMDEEEIDTPYDVSSSAAWKLGYSGGKAEAVAREVFNMTTTGKKEGFRFNLPKNQSVRRETKLSIGKSQIGFAWVSSIAEAEKYLQELEEEGRDDIHYIEIMACLGGCAGGGGQPISRGFENARARKRFCVEMEKLSPVKLPSENPVLKPVMGDSGFDPGNSEAREWLINRFIKKQG